MAAISSKDANDIVTSLGLLSFAIKNNGKVSSSKPTHKSSFAYSLFSLDRTMKDMVSTLNSIFLMLKRSVDVRAENERRSRYFEKEAALEKPKLEDTNRPKITATKVFSIAEAITNPFLKAAIGIALYSLLPKDIKDKLSKFTEGVARSLGYTEEEFNKFKDNLKTTGIVIASLGAINLASTLLPAMAALGAGFVAFCKRFGIKAPIALAAIAAGAGFGVKYLKEKWDEDVGDFEKAIRDRMDDSANKPSGAPISSLPTTGRSVSLSTPTERLKEIISRGESKGDYNVVFGAGVYPTPEQTVGKSLTDMTVDEVINYQEHLWKATKGNIGKGENVGTTAVGKYQIIKPTLVGLINKGVVRRDEKFTPAVQERLGTALIEEARSSSRTDEGFSKEINRIWEGARTNAQQIDATSEQITSALEGITNAMDELQKGAKTEPPTNNTGRNVAGQSQANRSAATRASSAGDIRKYESTTQSTDDKALQKAMEMNGRRMDNPNGPELPIDR